MANTVAVVMLGLVALAAIAERVLVVWLEHVHSMAHWQAQRKIEEEEVAREVAAMGKPTEADVRRRMFENPQMVDIETAEDDGS